MKFKVDENLPADVVALLIAAGHDAHDVHIEQLSGVADPSIAATCIAEGRCLITMDADFCDTRRFPPHAHAGLIVLRVHRSKRSAVRAIERVLAHVSYAASSRQSVGC